MNCETGNRYFSDIYQRDERLRQHGLSGALTNDDVASYCMNLEDKLDTLSSALGLDVYQDIRGRWHVERAGD